MLAAAALLLALIGGTFADPHRDTKALLAWNGETVVLSFRGTASLQNACSDIQVRVFGSKRKRRLC